MESEPRPPPTLMSLATQLINIVSLILSSREVLYSNVIRKTEQYGDRVCQWAQGLVGPPSNQKSPVFCWCESHPATPPLPVPRQGWPKPCSSNNEESPQGGRILPDPSLFAVAKSVLKVMWLVVWATGPLLYRTVFHKITSPLVPLKTCWHNLLQRVIIVAAVLILVIWKLTSMTGRMCMIILKEKGIFQLRLVAVPLNLMRVVINTADHVFVIIVTAGLRVCMLLFLLVSTVLHACLKEYCTDSGRESSQERSAL
nr:PREDICTED: uncharacterized protein LOC107079942 [Lepisosteus oculatus]